MNIRAGTLAHDLNYTLIENQLNIWGELECDDLSTSQEMLINVTDACPSYLEIDEDKSCGIYVIEFETIPSVVGNYNISGPLYVEWYNDTWINVSFEIPCNIDKNILTGEVVKSWFDLKCITK